MCSKLFCFINDKKILNLYFGSLENRGSIYFFRGESFYKENNI